MAPFKHDETKHGKEYRDNNHDQKSIRIFLQRVRNIHPVQTSNQVGNINIIEMDVIRFITIFKLLEITEA